MDGEIEHLQSGLVQFIDHEADDALAVLRDHADAVPLAKDAEEFLLAPGKFKPGVLDGKDLGHVAPNHPANMHPRPGSWRSAPCSSSLLPWIWTTTGPEKNNSRVNLPCFTNARREVGCVGPAEKGEAESTRSIGEPFESRKWIRESSRWKRVEKTSLLLARSLFASRPGGPRRRFGRRGEGGRILAKPRRAAKSACLASGKPIGAGPTRSPACSRSRGEKTRLNHSRRRPFALLFYRPRSVRS